MINDFEPQYLKMSSDHGFLIALEMQIDRWLESRFNSHEHTHC